MDFTDAPFLLLLYDKILHVNLYPKGLRFMTLIETALHHSSERNIIRQLMLVMGFIE
jgi:hypothetical protein